MCVSESLSHVRLFVTPWTIATRLLCPWNSSGKNTGVGCHFLLQGIVQTQGSNQGLLYYTWDTLPSELLGKHHSNQLARGSKLSENKPGFSLLYGSYSCSKAQTTIFKILCTALLSKRKSRGPITRLLVDFSWTVPKSSVFPEEKSCWFAEPTRSQNSY